MPRMFWLEIKCTIEPSPFNPRVPALIDASYCSRRHKLGDTPQIRRNAAENLLGLA